MREAPVMAAASSPRRLVAARRWQAGCVAAAPGWPATRPSRAQHAHRARALEIPFAVIGSWVASMQRLAKDPFNTGFMTISNDPNDARSFPKGATEVNSRTIKPKVKNFDPKQRVTGIPGINVFGAPSSKQTPGMFTDLFQKK